MATKAQIKPYRVGTGTGLAEIWWKTGLVRIKATGAETDGRFSQVEVREPLGSAPPMHIHHQEDEAFYVLDGEVTVIVDEERLELAAGDFALVPGGMPHAYIVRSERARMLVTFSPAGFEEALMKLGVPATPGEAPPVDAVFPPPEEMGRAFAAYGCEIVGPPPTE